MKSSRNIKFIKTVRGSNIHSIPNSSRSKYLDLFMLQNERDRLNREYDIYNMKLQKNLIQLEEIDKRISALKREHQAGKGALLPKRTLADSGKKQNWQTVRIGY